MARVVAALSFSLAAGLVLACDPQASGSGGSQGELETPQVCKDYCDLEVSCDEVDRQKCEDGCKDYYLAAAATGGFCPQSFQELFGCVAELECDEYDQWLDPPEPPDDYPCRDEDDRYRFDCE
jgi:hypothetical protein